jgi:hypothetical protein
MMLPAYEAMTCEECGARIEPAMTTEVRRRARGFDSCLFRCVCGVAYSNAASPQARRKIYRDPELNVPLEVRGGLADVLARSVNELNRESKRESFCSTASEDAVTWTVFRYLASSGTLDVVAEVAGASAASQTPALLLWGAPADETEPARTLAARLARVSAELGEDPHRRTEPDVVVAWPELLLVIEVKYRSGNDRKPDYPHFWRYLDREELFAVSTAEIERDGRYELTRNWRVAAGLAEPGSSAMVVNLGLRGVAADGNDFASKLAVTANRRFVGLEWQTLVRAMRERAPLPAWLEKFLGERQLDGRSS